VIERNGWFEEWANTLQYWTPIVEGRGSDIQPIVSYLWKRFFWSIDNMVIDTFKLPLWDRYIRINSTGVCAFLN
jgi:hypothetical protein